MSEVTHILDRVQRGEAQAAEELLPLVYEELRRLAAYQMAHEAPGQTLQPTALVHVDDALAKLAAEDRLKAELVKLRFFVGLSIPEAGRVLGLSESTTKRYWAYARAWLYDELTRGE